jgi:hypothetical protein
MATPTDANIPTTPNTDIPVTPNVVDTTSPEELIMGKPVEYWRNQGYTEETIKLYPWTMLTLEDRTKFNVNQYGSPYGWINKQLEQELDYFINQKIKEGLTKEEAMMAWDAIKAVARGGVGGGKGSSVGGYDANGNPTPGGQYNAQGQYVGTAAGTPEEIAKRQSAYDLLYQQFEQYGMGALVTPLKNLILQNVSPSEFTLRLRETDAYKNRFAANAQRIAKGLSALSEAEYINLEDQYQSIMRNYGLPESYYARGDMGRQAGFEKFIAGDVSATELEDRIQTAYNRVINAAPEVASSLKSFYPNISDGDILAYVLDPEKAMTEIKRKITAAEIGAGAAMAGLSTGVTRAEELAKYGVTAESARTGFQTVAEVAPRGTQLSEFYKQTPYTQTTAEQEVFGLTGATEAAKQRKKLSQLEQASFSGSSGMAGGALARDRAGSF